MTVTAAPPTTASGARPGGADTAQVADVLACYARQVDELARMMEDFTAVCTGHVQVLAHALGELHVVLDEAATTLNHQDGQR